MTGPLPEALTDRTAFLLRVALARAEAMGEEALAPLSLAGREYGVLALARHAPTPFKQRELGAALGIDRTTTMKLVGRLRDRGLVTSEPDPEDRRAHRVVATAAGRDLADRAAAVLAGCDADFTDRLDPDEVEVLAGLLRRLA